MNVGNATSFTSEMPLTDSDGNYGTWDGYTGFYAKKLGSGGSTKWTGATNCYGFYSDIEYGTKNGKQRYGIYINSNCQNVLSGQLTTGANVHPGASYAFRANGNTTLTNFQINTDGVIRTRPTWENTNSNTDHAVKINTSYQLQRITSSRRYKNNIQTLENVGGLDVINNLEPRQWNDLNSGELTTGFVAEEVATAGANLAVVYSPFNNGMLTRSNEHEPVTRDNAPLAEGVDVIDSINDRGLIMHLVQAVKDLKAENDDLKSRLEALEGN